MSLVSYRKVLSLKNYLIVTFFVTGFSLTGCGGSEEATQTEGQPEEQKLGEQKKDENPYGQALTSFVAEEKKQEPAQAEQKPVEALPASVSYEKQIEELRTENTSLKQRIVKLEQDNRTMNARLADTEAQVTAEKDRADKAEAMAKSMPVTSSQPTVTSTKGSEVTSSPMDISNYEDALKAFNAKKYEDAMKGFDMILGSGIKDDVADNCKYWIGECYFAKKQYANAIKNFEEVMAYKNSEKKADAQFMMAQSLDRLGKKQEAKDAYEKIVKDFPSSKNVQKAKARWARL